MSGGGGDNNARPLALGGLSSFQYPTLGKFSSGRSHPNRDAPTYRWSENEEEIIAKARYELRGEYKELVGKQGTSFWQKVWALVKSWNPAWDRPVDAVKVKIHRLERKYRDILEEEAQPGAESVRKPLWWKWLSLYMAEKLEEEQQAARESWREVKGADASSDQQAPPSSSFRPFSQALGPVQTGCPPPAEGPTDGADGSGLQQVDGDSSTKRKRDGEPASTADESPEGETESVSVKKKKRLKKKGGSNDVDLSEGAAAGAADTSTANGAAVKDYERWSEAEQVLVARARFELNDEYKKRPQGQQGSFYGRLKEYIRTNKDPSFDRPFEAIKLKLHRMERKYKALKERLREQEAGVGGDAGEGAGDGAYPVLKPKWFKWIDRYLSETLGFPPSPESLLPDSPSPEPTPSSSPSQSDAPGDGLTRATGKWSLGQNGSGRAWKGTGGTGANGSLMLPPSASVTSQPNVTNAGGGSGNGGENASGSASVMVSIVTPGAMKGPMPPPPHLLTSPAGFLPPPPPGFYPPGSFFPPGVFPHSFSAASSNFRPPGPAGSMGPGGMSPQLLSPQGAGVPGNPGVGGGSAGGAGMGAGVSNSNGAAGAATTGGVNSGATGAGASLGGFLGQLTNPGGDGNSMAQEGAFNPGGMPGGAPFPGALFAGQSSSMNANGFAGLAGGNGSGGGAAGAGIGGGSNIIGGSVEQRLEQKLEEVIRVVREGNEQWQRRFSEEQEKNRQLFRELFMTFIGPRINGANAT